MTYFLLTGSEGLIGGCLSDYLTQAGMPFRRFDLRCSPSQNILNYNKVTSALEGCTGIIHLAGTSRVIAGQKNPALCLAQNVKATHFLLKAALQNPYKPWFLYASSREVYGQQESLPVFEDAVLKPMNIYAHSKALAESIIFKARQAGLTTAILRFSNVFGSPFDHPDRVIPAFCRAALEGKTLRVEGLKNIFDFTFVEDVVRGIASILSILMSKAENLPPIHLTMGRGISLQEAATTIIKLANSTSNLEEMPPRSFDVSQFYGNPARAKSLLSWAPQFSFEEAITRFLERLRPYLEEPSATRKACG